jgi:hypothetical protein
MRADAPLLAIAAGTAIRLVSGYDRAHDTRTPPHIPSWGNLMAEGRCDVNQTNRARSQGVEHRGTSP